MRDFETRPLFKFQPDRSLPEVLTREDLAKRGWLGLRSRLIWIRDNEMRSQWGKSQTMYKYRVAVIEYGGDEGDARGEDN